MSVPLGPESERFHVGRGDQTLGPYTIAEIRQFWESAQLTDTDFVWLASDNRWAALPEILNLFPVAETATIEATHRTFCFCLDHRDVPASGHCYKCTRFLCAGCLRYRMGGFYCPECVKVAEGHIETSTSGFLEKAILSFKERPVFGVCLVLGLFLFLSGMSGSMKSVKTKGVKNYETERYLLQGFRAQRMADVFFERNEERRYRRWYQLEFAAAKQVMTDKTVADDIRAQCYTMQLRSLLHSRDFDAMEKLLKRFSKRAAKLGREDDYKFYRACFAYLGQKDDYESSKVFMELKDKLVPKQSKFGMMWGQTMTDMDEMNPQFAMIFGMSGSKRSFTNTELLYRYGEVLEMKGKKEESQSEWKEAAQQPGQSIWHRMASSRINP